MHNIQTSANETHSKISFQTTGSETSSRPEIGLKNSKLLEVHDDDDGEYPATINKTEEEDFLFLTDSKSEIVDVEVDNESKSIEDALNCKYCHSDPCKNGNYLTLFKPASIGIIVQYVGKDANLFGKTGFVDYYVNGDLLIKWLDDCSRIKIPMFHLPDETKPDIYFQFKYSCDKTIVGKHEEEFGAIQPIQRGISAANENENDYGCPNCHSDPCRNGQFLLQLLDVYDCSIVERFMIKFLIIAQ